MSDPVSTRMGDCLWTGKPFRYVTSQLGQLSLSSLQVDKSSTNLPGWGEGRAVTSVGWQITMWSHWHMASRSSEVNFRKNYTLLYLLPLTNQSCQVGRGGQHCGWCFRWGGGGGKGNSCQSLCSTPKSLTDDGSRLRNVTVPSIQR